MVDTTAPTGEFRVGSVIGSAFSIFGQHWGHFIGLGIVVLVPGLVLQLLIGSSPDASLGAEAQTPGDGIAGIVNFLLAFLLTAAVTFSAFDALRDRPQSIGSALQRGTSRFPAVLGLGLLILLVVLVIGAIGGGIIFLLITTLESGPLAVVAGVILFCVMVWIFIRWAVATPAVVIERVGAITGLGRSASLTSGQRWKMLGIFLLMMIIFIVAGAVIPLVVLGIIGFAGIPAGVVLVVAVVLMFLIQVVSTVLSALLICVAYYHLRRAKEGVGLDEIAAVFD